MSNNNIYCVLRCYLIKSCKLTANCEMFFKSKIRKLCGTAVMQNLHSEPSHSNLFDEISEKGDVLKASIEQFNELLITNSSRSPVLEGTIRIVVNKGVDVNIDKFEKVLGLIGKKMKTLRIDMVICAESSRCNRRTVTKNSEFDKIIEIIARKCTQLKRFEIYDYESLSSIWEEKFNYSRTILKRVEELRIVGNNSTKMPDQALVKSTKNMYKLLCELPKSLHALEAGQNVSNELLVALIKSNGSNITKLKVVVDPTHRNKAITRLITQNCPKLRVFECYLSIPHDAFGSVHADLLTTYGKQLLFANLDNIDEENCKRIANGCPNASFNMVLDARRVGVWLASPRVLGNKLKSLKAEKSEDDSPWRASLEACSELDSLSVDISEYDELKTLITSKMAKLRNLTVSTLNGQLNNYSLDVIARNTGNLRELKIFCGRVHEKALRTTIEANQDIEYLQLDIDFCGFEESKGLDFVNSEKLEEVFIDELRLVLLDILDAISEHKKLREIDLFGSVTLDHCDWRLVVGDHSPTGTEEIDFVLRKWGADMAQRIINLVDRDVGVKLCGQRFYPVGFWEDKRSLLIKRFFDGKQDSFF